MKIIGISANAARSGKDTLAKCLSLILTEKGKKVAIRSLAAPLKQRLKEFVFQEFGFDVENCTDEEKTLIRPLLVAYGGAKRRQTEGGFWTRLMDQEIVALRDQGYDFLIVPDIRYGEYAGDEIFWLKRENSGVLFFVSLLLGDGSILPPPNEDEGRNAPILKSAADFEITWPHLSFEECCLVVKRHWAEFEKKL